jgi:site-specific recombinase XerD
MTTTADQPHGWGTSSGQHHRRLARFPAVDDLVFTGSHGQPWRRGTFAELVRDARQEAGLPPSVTFHDLRHYYASALIAAGSSIKAVQEALGHKNARETLDT